MKKILFTFLILFPLLAKAQVTNIVETKEIEMTKNELFSKTKMFISDKWKNPKSSIQNDDKDAGIIQVKTEKEISFNVGMGLKCIYEYEYLTKFRFKDNKYRIEIYDIKCTSAVQSGLGSEKEIPLIPYFTGDNVPQTKKMGRGISEKKAKEMMNELNNEFSEIINSYNNFIGEKDDF